MDYDTDWARRYPARLGRVLVSELIAGPVVHAVASPRVAGLDRIAHLDEPVIFAANHASHLDAPLLLSVIPEKWRHHMFVAGAADYFFDTRVKAVTFAFLLNAVPIERQRVSRDSANRVAALLAEGWSLLDLPRGGPQPRRLGPAAPGRGGLAGGTYRPARRASPRRRDPADPGQGRQAAPAGPDPRHVRAPAAGRRRRRPPGPGRRAWSGRWRRWPTSRAPTGGPRESGRRPAPVRR